MTELTEKDLIVGHTYSAKKPRRMLFGNDNRTIVWSNGIDKVQYDSDTVGIGRRLPIVFTVQFLKWAKDDVTQKKEVEQ